jgi:hypothetical protein
VVAEGVGLCRALRGAAMLAAVPAGRGPTTASRRENAFVVFGRRLSPKWNISSHGEHPPTTRTGLRRNLHRACTHCGLVISSEHRSIAVPVVSTRSQPSLCIVKGSGAVEPFVRAHADGLPAKVTLIHELPPRIEDRPILLQSVPGRACRKALRLLRRREWEWEITSAYLKAFRRARPDAVLAEFGQTGVAVLNACRRMNLPLIVHFHWADISKHAVLRIYAEKY